MPRTTRQRGSMSSRSSASIGALSPALPARRRLPRCAASRDFERWADEGFGVPDFLDSLVAFQPQQHRIDGLRHLVVFPMYTQNGSPEPPRRGAARRGDLAGVHRRAGAGDYVEHGSSCRSGSSTSRRATTRTRRCCSPRRSRCARSRPSPGARSSRTARPRASAGSCAPQPGSRSSTCPTTPARCSTTRRSPSRPS